MKKVFLVSLFIALLGSVTIGQNYKVIKGIPINKPLMDNKPVHWGFTFGINKTDFSVFKNESLFHNDTINIYGIESTSMPGFFLGPVFNVRLGKYFDLRFLIDISFTQRNFTYYHFTGIDTAATLGTTIIKVPSSFIEFPILLKYKGARLNNVRPYFILGTAGKYDLASLRKINVDEPHLQVAPFDVYLELGPGMDFYLPYFKFSIEFKYSNGFFNLLEKDNSIYSTPLDGLKSHSFMLSFHFEG
ncbi:MAG: PorT family protein [Bacteroidales bacterium]|nr:PorT family protein [Bacteroidales bacterium]